METLKQSKNLFIIEGVLFLILGLLAITLPVIFTFGIELIFGSLLIVGGLLQGYRAYTLWERPGFYTSVFAAILSLLLGFIFIANPLRGVLTLTAILMIYFFISGVFKIILALELRPQPSWGWLILSGIIAIIMGSIIYSGWPSTALWVIGLLLGIDMLFFGISLLSLAFAMDRPKF